MKLYQALSGALLLSTLVACSSDKKNYDATGTFEATEVTISANASGELLHLSLTEGQEVKAGQVLGLVDTTQLHLRKLQLLSSAQAVGGRQSNVAIQVATLREQVAAQRRELARFTELQQQGAATEKQVSDLRDQLAITERQLTAQQDALTTNNRSLSDEVSTLGVQIQQVNDQLQKSVITAPIDGTVLAKYAEAGELAAPGRALFKLADLKQIYLRAYIDASQLTAVKLGQEVTVYADQGKSQRKAYKGQISWISGKAEFTPKTIQTRDERANLVYAVKIRVANDGLIKSGMYGEVKF